MCKYQTDTTPFNCQVVHNYCYHPSIFFFTTVSSEIYTDRDSDGFPFVPKISQKTIEIFVPVQDFIVQPNHNHVGILHLYTTKPCGI